MKILNFGSANIDFVYKLKNIVSPGETVSATSISKFPGGKGLNQSVAIAKSGSKVYHAGLIGEDGEFLRDILNEANVNTTYLKTVSEPTGHAMIQVDDNGENSIIIYKGANGKVTKDFIDDVLKNFAEGDILVLQNEINNIDYLIKKAAEKGLKIVLNPSPFTEKLKEIDLNLIWFLILNRVEGQNWSGEKTPHLILNYLNKSFKNLNVVLTLGSVGCIYGNGKEQIFCPSFKTSVVDTTGAGDTFTGYFISAVSKNESILNSLKFASAASAIAISKSGAAISIPYAREVKAALKELKPSIDKNFFELENKKSSVKEYIRNNILSVNLEEVSKFLGYNTAYTSSWIKKNFNKSFTDIVLEIKCEEIAKLLVETNLSVNEVVQKVGYQNEDFIRKKFIEIYNKSFKEYRKENK